jgi:transglutaminase superfamily protein
MNKLYAYALLITFFISNEAYTQMIKFGEVSIDEVAMQQDPDFPDANAVVLYRDVNSYLGRYVEVHERIKIFNEEGYDYATIRIPYPDVTKLNGATYNLVNGVIVETELDKDLIFTDEVIKGVDIKKFTFPNISPGSVLELSYKSLKGTGADIDLQYDIPIRKLKVKITNRSEIGIEILQNPRAFLNVTRVENSKSTTFIANLVPALEPENYVYDMDLYRSYITMNVTSATNSFRFGTWKSLIDILSEIDNFWSGMKPKKFYKEELTKIVGDEIDVLKKTKLIYNQLRKDIKWNEDYGFIPDQKVRDTYKDKEGSIADINTLFISMIRSVGIQADPVLVSTKINGIPLTASANAFNALIAAVKIGEKTYLFDVAHKKSNVNFLAAHFLNWEGLRIYNDESYDWVPLTKTKISIKHIIANATMDDDFMLIGDVKERHGGYYSIDKRHDIKDLGENTIETILVYDYEGLEVYDMTASVKKSDYVDISYDFELENAIDEIEGKLYFSPLLFFALDENPFQKEERKYSIDFEFPFKNQTMLTINIPGDYQVESLPKASKIVLPENAGSFTYRISSSGPKIQVSTVFQINTPNLSYEKYQSIKEFFKVRMSKESEKIVLSKI